MTEQQEKFLNALFGEAQGNFREAMSIAGYAPTEYPARLTRQMKNEIIERAEYMLAANAPKAVLSMSGIRENRTQDNRCFDYSPASTRGY
jgi:hypothetical protein